MTVDYMSSENTASESSSGEENGEESDSEANSPKVLIKHSLRWRSNEVNQLMASLDRRVRKRRGQKGQSMLFERKVGSNSSRPVPIDAPQWAISQ